MFFRKNVKLEQVHFICTYDNDIVNTYDENKRY